MPRYAGRAAPAVANQLSQSGPIARTVEDAAILLQALAGYDARDAGSLRDAPADYLAALDRDISGLRIGWSPDFGYAAVDPEVVDVCGKAAQEFGGMGCSIDEDVFSIEAPQEAFRALFAVNTYASSGYLLHERADDLTDYFRANMEYAATLTAADYAKAIGELDIVKARFDDYFENYDLLLSPTMAVPAFEIDKHPGPSMAKRLTHSSATSPSHTHKRDRTHCGERALRLFFGRHAHRLAYRWSQGRRRDGAGGIGGVRAGAALGGQTAARELISGNRDGHDTLHPILTFPHKKEGIYEIAGLTG